MPEESSMYVRSTKVGVKKFCRLVSRKINTPTMIIAVRAMIPTRSCAKLTFCGFAIS